MKHAVLVNAESPSKLVKKLNELIQGAVSI